MICHFQGIISVPNVPGRLIAIRRTQYIDYIKRTLISSTCNYFYLFMIKIVGLNRRTEQSLQTDDYINFTQYFSYMQLLILKRWTELSDLAICANCRLH